MKRFSSLLPRTVRRVAFMTLLVACGSRTGLFVDESFGPLPTDGGADVRDGGRDGEPDALPPIDARPPQDVDRRDCVDAGQTFVYVITTQYDLYSFNPPDSAFKLIGNIKCPAGKDSQGNAATPFSMAVDRKGVAFVLFNDERLYRVSTLTAACIATSYAPRQSNFGLFGMGFATIGGGPAEALYVAGDTQNGVGSTGASGLARIDTTTFKLTPIASQFTPNNIERAELSGTGDGRLFAFYDKNGGAGGGDPPTFIGEVDTNSGKVFAEATLNAVGLGEGWAFAFWGGDFYTFTAASDTQSRVHRYQPSNNSVTQVATLPRKIVGAGVSTCAPQE